MDDGRRKSGGLVLAALLVLLAQGARSQDLSLAAQSAALVDSYSGEFLYTKNPDAKEYSASSTKILTALIAIEAGNLDQIVTVAPEETNVDPRSIDLNPGQQFARRQLLFGMLLKSANDVAMCLSRDNAGSVPAFAEKMNLRAAELRAASSHCVNPDGLHDPNPYTTAHDVVLIARAAMHQPLFRQIVSTIYSTWRPPT